MARRRIVLAIENASAMGRGVIQGVAEFAHGRETWCFASVTEASRFVLGQEVTPETADAVIGVIRPDIAERWPGEHRRRVVNVSRGYYVRGGANVTCDDTAIGRTAADYLLGKNLHHFAFFGIDGDDARAQPFMQSIRRAGQTCRYLEAAVDDAALGEAIRALPRPCGILAFNDLHATRLIELAESLGLGVPADLAIMGVDNDVLVNVMSPTPVTSVAVDFQRVGYEAAQVLSRMLRGDDPPAEPIRIPPTGVVERESTDFPGELDPLAVRAARLIRARACEDVRLAELIEQLPATYRTVDRRFRAAFGRSMKAEVTTHRMAEAARLLTTTRLPLWAVAQQVGYGDTNYFNSVFSKEMGTPPGTYRREHGEQVPDRAGASE